MARKRYQRGALRKEGNLWILRWREDVLNKAGAVVRLERRARVGATKDLPTKALARRVADRMIEHVNQPNYSRRIPADHRRSSRAMEHLFRVHGLPRCAHE